jgi:Uma2 family endonuclease
MYIARSKVETMSLPMNQPVHTVEEYLALERESEERHEYLDGQIYEMAGESLEHGDISVNLVRELSTQLRGTPCRVLTKDTKVLNGPAIRSRRSTKGLFSYPDLVVCREPKFLDEHRDVLRNPTVSSKCCRQEPRALIAERNSGATDAI